MAYIKQYWENKDDRKTKAIAHTKEMQDRYANEISASIANTKVYDTDFLFERKKEHTTDIEIVDMDSVSVQSVNTQMGKLQCLILLPINIQVACS